MILRISLFLECLCALTKCQITRWKKCSDDGMPLNITTLWISVVILGCGREKSEYLTFHATAEYHMIPGGSYFNH